jgi:hypothetical protein
MERSPAPAPGAPPLATAGEGAPYGQNYERSGEILMRPTSSLITLVGEATLARTRDLNSLNQLRTIRLRRKRHCAPPKEIRNVPR